MKRGKDDEKIMGPMFPRLHVNDQEKGGPRAPPRNKMALYEQLSIPSQRFSRPGMMPHNHDNNANFTPPASSSQRNGHDRSVFSPVQVPPKPPSRYLNPSPSLPQVEQRRESDEDDFTVPIFVVSKTGENCGDHQNIMDREKLFPSSPDYSSYSKLQGTSYKDPKQNGMTRPNVRQNSKAQYEDSIAKAVSYSQSMDKTEGSPKQADTSLPFEPRDNTSNDFIRLQKANSRLRPAPEQRTDSQSRHIRGHMFSSQVIDVNRENSSVLPRKFPALRDRDVFVNERESCEEQTRRSLQASIGERGDEVSDTSMVESVSEMDISPDDVVGIIGQKHFWKARRAIVNQQRVFAVQVFELHRLIKVQRLIAESPHLLLEDNAYPESPIIPSSAKKLPLEYIVQPPLNISEQKNESEKPNDKMECSAENTVAKASLSSVQNGIQPLNYKQFVGNPQPTPVTGDPNMGPWCFHPQQGHHWLVPVMTPTEGLVYKPYSGPAFTNPLYGGHGPPGSTLMMGNFMSPQHYQETGVPPFFPPAGPHGYFPQYGMPVMNPSISGQAVEQTSHLITQDSQGEFLGGRANFSAQRQNSCNQTTQEGGAFTHIQKSKAPKDKELHASTASSPIGRAQGSRLSNTMEGNHVLPLFPTSPPTTTDVTNGNSSRLEDERTSRVIRVVPQNGSASHVEDTQPSGVIRVVPQNGSPSRVDDEQPSQVIRVVPHNKKSASVFAARIFRSIQEERKQNDYV